MIWAPTAEYCSYIPFKNLIKYLNTFFILTFFITFLQQPLSTHITWNRPGIIYFLL